ncbi:MAG: penicillin-binding transpeptidase domain-containing protein [Actinomycetaceae bacterium]|nr:penicillin-binding transpeptidase domain-containing protein [Actinomycetaceae bacterium]
MNRPIRKLATLVFAMFLSLMLMASYVQFIQAPSLNADDRNVRSLYREYGTDRGPIIVGGESVVVSTPSDGPYKYQREYKEGSTYAHVTGYFSTGLNSKWGIEKAENGVLGGSDSALAGQRLQQLISGSQPQGGGVELTIDPATQKAAIQALNGQKGAVVALDPKTGAILAQVSYPSYDPNLLATSKSSEAKANWAQLEGDENKPLVDRATGGDQYAPGSTFKMLTATAMLENQDLTPDSVIDTPDSYTPPDTSQSIENPGEASCGDGSGRSTLRQAFIQSCNTPFAQGGVNVGSDKMLEQAKKFGIGETFETPLKVSASRFPEPDSQAALAKDSIGQQDIRVTPMQMAMIGAAIANDGVVMEPHIVKQTLTRDLEVLSTTKPSEYSRAMSPQTAEYMQDMMVEDVKSGTGYRAAIDGIEVGGKTGTAEINSNTPPHVWFVSYAPADDPQIAVAVVVENAGHTGWSGDGGSVAAPIARQVMLAYLGNQ